jgi:hypothetical protein
MGAKKEQKPQAGPKMPKHLLTPVRGPKAEKRPKEYMRSSGIILLGPSTLIRRYEALTHI